MKRKALSLVALTALSAVASASDFVGQATVTDADSLVVQGRKLRLHGIDAPESAQLCRNADSVHYRCGQQAANALAEFLAGRHVSCVDTDQPTYDRTVAVCSVGKVDIADWLVRQGYALDWPKYSKGDYADAQAEARRNERGIWSGSFIEPWRYRACVKEGSRPLECSDEAR